MAGSVNKVILVGNLGAEPEIKATRDGRSIANFNLATTETWRDKVTNEKKEKTEWHRIVIFSEGLVRVAQQYLRKGAKVYIEGQLQTRKWEDQNGTMKYTTEIILRGYSSQLTILSSKAATTATATSGAADSPSQNYNEGDGGKNLAHNKEEDFDDDIPF